MVRIKIEGEYIDIDIREELEQFEWNSATWTDVKLVAASPFRYDRTPSFFVDLTSGGWADSGAYDTEWESGNLAKLLSFLRNETYEETCEYLIEVYGVRKELSGRIKLPTVRIRERRPRIVLDNSILRNYRYYNSYLESRAISPRVAKFMRAGYSPSQRAITLPWFHPDGTLANIKFRKTCGKTFWYYKGGSPIRTLIYGIDKVYRHDLCEVVVCEAEIDALSWWTAKRPAIAVGGTSVTETQLNIIRKSPIETLILALDNDKPGTKLGDVLTKGLKGYVTIKQVRVPQRYKDANEALVDGVDLEKLPIQSYRSAGL